MKLAAIEKGGPGAPTPGDSAKFGVVTAINFKELVEGYFGVVQVLAMLNSGERRGSAPVVVPLPSWFRGRWSSTASKKSEIYPQLRVLDLTCSGGRTSGAKSLACQVFFKALRWHAGCSARLYGKQW